MATKITGLDIGTYSVKLVRIEPGREARVVAYYEEPIGPVRDERAGPAEPDRSEDGSSGPPPMPGRDTGPRPSDFDDESDTVVRSRADIEAAGGQAAGGQAAGGDWDAEAHTPAGDAEAGEAGEAAQAVAPADEGLAGWQAALHRLAQRGAFDDESLIVTFLPDGQAMSIHQPVPFTEPAKVENILPHMLDDRLPISFDKVVYDFRLIEGTVDEGAEAVVGFARRDDMRGFLDEVKAEHLNPAVVGIPELLLDYVLARVAPDAMGTYALVDIGHRYTRVLVLDGGEPVLARQVQYGGRDITEAMANRLKLSAEQAEALKHARGQILGPADAPTDQTRQISDCITDSLRPFVRDLRRTFQSLYARTRVQIDTIYVCGGTSRLRNLPDYLGDQFGVAVERLPVDRVPGMIDTVVEEGKDQALALGLSLALQQVDDRGGDRLIDLRKEEFTYRGKSSYLRSQLTRYGVVAAAVFVCLLAFLWSEKMELDAQRDAMRQALKQQTTELFGQPVYTSKELKQHISGEAGVAAGGGFLPEMSAYQLMHELTSRISDDVELELDRLEVDVDRNLVQVYGETSNAQAVDRLVGDLEGLECLEEIRKDKLRVIGDDRAEFELHISSECS